MHILIRHMCSNTVYAWDLGCSTMVSKEMQPVTGSILDIQSISNLFEENNSKSRIFDRRIKQSIKRKIEERTYHNVPPPVKKEIQMMYCTYSVHSV